MPQLRQIAWRLGGCIIVCSGLILPPIYGAQGAALQVSPIRLDLGADQPAAVLTLHNDGQVPLDAQVRVFAWSQSPDEDRLDRTVALVASPPIVRIAPNEDQTVRILRVANTPLVHEETYRLLIDEIPDGHTQSEGIRMQLRYSVPVFAGATDVHVNALSFALERGSATDGTSMLMLRASNAANGHAQLSRVRLEWSNGQSTALSDGLLGYALPGATRRWPVADVPAGMTSATLHALVNGVPLTAHVAIEGVGASNAASSPPSPAR